jgi:hypothetical protein
MRMIGSENLEIDAAVEFNVAKIARPFDRLRAGYGALRAELGYACG